MHTTRFVPSYTSITESGARWIVANTSFTLVGLDYLGVATYEDNTIVHQLMLGKVSA